MSHLIHIFCGFLMGCADVVPGVSGGTVALILRIYDRLITAISKIDREFVLLLSRGRFAAATRHIDFFFLASLAVGIMVGVVVMTLAVGALFGQDFSRTITLAAFFGMILATGLVIGRLLKPAEAGGWLPLLIAGVAAAGISLTLASLDKSKVDPSYPYLFLCGSIGICAMILPGISGAVILWVLGVYHFLTAIPKALIHREEIVTNFVRLGVFAAGCLVGLLSFSKVMRWLLGNHRQVTLAALCGFVVGALRALWPFQRDLTPELAVRHKDFEPYLPTFDSVAVYALVAAVAGFALVFVADNVGRSAYAKRSSGKEEGKQGEETNR